MLRQLSRGFIKQCGNDMLWGLLTDVLSVRGVSMVLF